MSWAELLSKSSASGVQVYDGLIAEDAADLNDPVKVTLPGYSSQENWGPANWMPRVEEGPEGLEVSLPNKGDRCVVVLAETDDPGEPEVWIVGWFPNG